MVTLNLDQDGFDDIVFGAPAMVAPFTDKLGVYLSSKPDEGLHIVDHEAAVDLEVADVNGDGIDDLTAQRREYISDFPSFTHVLLGQTSSPYLVRVQEIYNADNHTDNEELADVNKDGCVDLLHIGVDNSTVYVMHGELSSGICTGKLVGDQNDQWFRYPGAPSTVGVQFLDLNGDGSEEVVVRELWVDESGNDPYLGDRLRILPLDLSTVPADSLSN